MNWEASDLESAWKRFVVHVNFVFDGPLKKKTEEEKCAYLMIWVGEKGRTLFETWTLTADERKVLKTYLDKFEAHVKPKTNIVFNRYKFQSRIQSESETFDQFVTDLQTLVKECSYDKEDEMVRDRIVFGVKSRKIREKLICEGSTLTLVKTVDIARSYEIAKSQSQQMNKTENPVHAVRARNPKRETVYNNECTRCGNVHVKDKCPAIGQLCKKCVKKDHFAKKCRTKVTNKWTKRSVPSKHRSKKHNVHHVDKSSDSESESEFYVGMITVNAVNTDWLIETNIKNKPVKMQLDTGAKCNVMSVNTFENLKLKCHVEKTDSILKSYSGHTMTTEGIVSLPVKVKDSVYEINFHLVQPNVETILGAEACVKMNLVKRVSAVENQTNHVKSENTGTPKDICKKFPDIFTGLGCLPGKHHINLDNNCQPKVHPPRKVPVALKDKVKKELDSMERQGVIVKQRKPTDWVSSMLTVVKPNGKLRICMDPKDLNEAIKREHHPLKTIEEILPEINGAKIFTKLDATSGFWQCALDEESSELCTFNSPYGRYSFTRLPYGIKSAPEVYQRTVSELLQDLDGCETIVDDILIWGKDLKEHDERLEKVLTRIQKNNLKLNKDKCEFRKSSLTYVGHLITADGVKPDPEKVRAVAEMPRPTNTKELQTFLGFINYLTKFIPNLSQKTQVLRQLLQKDTEWSWDPEHDLAFETLKACVSSTPVLKYYDPSKPLILSVDASSKGIGAVLIQDGQPIAYGSRALTSAQQNYPQIEKEALGISYGCTKFHQFVFGRHVKVETDHKPLQSIFNKQLHRAPPRLQSILLSLQKYDLEVMYKPGSEMYISDCLSRAYLNETKENLNTEDVSVNLLSYLPVSPEKLKVFQAETQKDAVLVQLKETVETGWPERKDDIPCTLEPYWNFRDEISVTDGLLFKSHKLIVPKSMRPEMLDLIHEAHLGIVKCKNRARETLFWPGMSKEVEQKVKACETCAENANRNPKEPMVEREIPNRPWSMISVDLFYYKGNNYLLSMDRYSSWPEIAKLDNLSSENTIMYMKSQFSRYGVPDEVYSDNGPQFASVSFSNFSKEYGFVHKTSSPTYAQSNGHIERAVQTVKNLLKKAKDPYKSIMGYRDTVIEGMDKSPAQLFLGRRLKTSLPVTAPLLKQPGSAKIVKKRQNMQHKQKLNFDKRTKEQKTLSSGENVMMKRSETKSPEQPKWEPATVIQEHESPRSYLVRDRSGQLLRRNRKHLRATNAQFDHTTSRDEDFDPPDRHDPPTTWDPPDLRDPSAITDPHPVSRDDSPSCHVTKPTTRAGREIRKPTKFKDYVT